MLNLSGGAGLVVGADQVGGIGQVDEQLLLRLQSRSREIQQQNLLRENQRLILGQNVLMMSFTFVTSCYFQKSNKCKYSDTIVLLKMW